jgi:uncharacterized membrane protein
VRLMIGSGILAPASLSAAVITDRPVVCVNIALANEGIARNQVFIYLSIMLAYVISLSS